MQEVAIKPYLRPEIDNQGLTGEGLVIADGCLHSQILRCIDNNGVKTYVTGINEGAPEVMMLQGDARDARILDIRKTVVMAENHIVGNFNITEKDIYKDDGKTFNPEFWTKVTKFKSVIADEFDNQGKRKLTFWDTVELKVGNVPIKLEQNKPMNVILLKAIEAGGFGNLICPSLEAAEKFAGNDIPKFYLDRLQETADMQIEVKILRNKAGTKLENMREKDSEKMFYLLKNLGTFSLGYRKSTPDSVLYNDLENFLDGLGTEKNKRVAIEQFLDMCDVKKVSGEELRIRAIAKDANALNIIVAKGEGNLYYNKTGTPIGKSFEDVVMWLKNPMNSKELMDITAIVEKDWNTPN